MTEQIAQAVESLESRVFCSVTLPPTLSIAAVPPVGGGAGRVELDIYAPPENVGKFVEIDITATDQTNSVGSQKFVISRAILSNYAIGNNWYRCFVTGIPGDHVSYGATELVKSSIHGYLRSLPSLFSTVRIPN